MILKWDLFRNQMQKNDLLRQGKPPNREFATVQSFSLYSYYAMYGVTAYG